MNVCDFFGSDNRRDSRLHRFVDIQQSQPLEVFLENKERGGM